MTMEPGGTGRMALSVGVLGVLAVAAFRTMEPGKYRQLTWLLLGFFALRVVLGWARSRRIKQSASARDRGRPEDVEG